jgi:accessory gene regulator B
MSIKLAVCMDRLLDKIIAFTYKNETIDPDRIEIVRYGLELFILKAVFLLASVIIALLMGEILSYLIFLMFFMPLRTLAGGYHAKTRLICFVESMATVVLVCGICKLMQTKSLSEIILFGVMTLISSVVIFLLSPVEDKNKPLSEEQKLSFQRKVRIYLLISLVVSTILVYFKLLNLTLPIILAVIITGCLVIVGFVNKKIIKIRRLKNDKNCCLR